MKRSQMIWTIVFALGAIGLLISAYRGAGRAYVLEEQTTYREFQLEVPVEGTNETEIVTEWKPLAATPVPGEEGEAPPVATGAPDVTLTTVQNVDPSMKGGPNVSLSWLNTIGIWIAGLLTLCVLSFLWGDNVFYKVAESIVIGSSAAYVMVAAFWPMLVENLMGNLVPGVVKAWANPGLDNGGFNEYYLVPAVFCVLLLWRLSPKGGWIARWPLAFFIGATAGFRLISHLEADFIQQIKAAIIPLWVTNAAGDFDLWFTLTNIIMTIGVLSTLTYFFFSVEHKGIIGKTARLGIWFLMVTFGAAFGYTVMGRIALLAERFQFIVDDWLWIIDPTGKRVVASGAAMVMGLF